MHTIFRNWALFGLCDCVTLLLPDSAPLDPSSCIPGCVSFFGFYLKSNLSFSSHSENRAAFFVVGSLTCCSWSSRERSLRERTERILGWFWFRYRISPCGSTPSSSQRRKPLKLRWNIMERSWSMSCIHKETDFRRKMITVSCVFLWPGLHKVLSDHAGMSMF